MELSERSIRTLGKIIVGDGELSPVRSNEDLADLFSRYGIEVDAPEGVSGYSRKRFTIDNLNHLNNTDNIRALIIAVMNFDEHFEGEYDLNRALFELNHFLQFDGYLVNSEPGGNVSIEEIGQPGDWYAGTVDSFFLECQALAEEVGYDIDDESLGNHINELFEVHAPDSIELGQFGDLGVQPALAQFVIHSLKKPPGSISESTNQALNSEESRSALQDQIGVLISILNDNIQAFEQGRNETPRLDLALHENPDYVDEIRALTAVLEKLSTQISQFPEREFNPSLSRAALDAFIVNFAAGSGTALGGIGTRTVVLFLAYGILKGMGAPVDDIFTIILRQLTG